MSSLAPIRIVIAGVDRFSNKMAKMQKSVKKISAGMTRAGSAMSAGITAPVLATGGAIFKAGYQFDKFMNMVEAKSTVSGKSIADLRKQALLLGSTTSFSHIQAAEGMNFLAQAGFKTGETFKTILPTLKLAQATTSELGNTADWLSNIMGGMEMGAEKSGYAASILAVTTAKANVNLEQLAGTFAKVGPVAKNYGATMKDVAAGAGFLGNIGIQDEAGTVLKNMFLNISSGAPKVAKAFRAIGVSVDDGKGNMRDFKDVLFDMSQGLQKVSQKKGMQVMEAIMGKRAIAGVTGLTNSLSKSNSKFTELVGILDKVGENDLNKMVETMRKGSVGAWDDTISALQGMGQAIADSGLMEFIIKGLKGLTKFFRFIAEQTPVVLKMGLVFAGVAAAVGPLLLVIGQVLPIITAMGAGIAKTGGIVALLSNPIGWAVLAVGGLIAVTAALWDELKPLRDMIGGQLTQAAQILMTLWEPMKKLFFAVGGAIKQIVLAIAPLAELFGVSFGGASLSGLESFVGGLNLVLAVVTKLVSWFTVLVGWIGKLTTGLNNMLAPAMKLGNSWLGEAAGGIAAGAGWIADALGGGENNEKLGLTGGPTGARGAGAGAVKQQAAQNGKSGEVVVRLPNLPAGATVQAQGVEVVADNGQILAGGL